MPRVPAPTPAAAAPAPTTPTHAVEVASVSKSFGDVLALDQVSLHLDDGEFVAVLGPSGCGKTTLLRCVAGFERIDAGRISLREHAVALPGIHLPTHRRQVAVVPQEGSLFPHLTVADNVGFGLSRRSGRGRAARVAACLELVGLDGLGARWPHEISGGQRQRVALARALAPDPSLVLLDEPFSALDASLRTELRAVVRDALRQAGATAVLVTHDQGEALSMADRVAVMREGRIRQVGTPEQVYAAPTDAWVARFVGEADLLPLGPLTEGTTGGSRMTSPLGPVTLSPAGVAPGTTHVVVRPEQVLLDQGGVPATVRAVDFHGHDALVTLTVEDGTVLRARCGPWPPAVGDRVRARVSGVCRAVPGEERDGPGGLPGGRGGTG
ncbi:ABC transporter ATP-binding protein [Serinicoccus sp. LYQ131]